MENLCTLFGVPGCEKECTVVLQQGLVRLLPVTRPHPYSYSLLRILPTPYCY
jgi:hypothetical protein